MRFGFWASIAACLALAPPAPSHASEAAPPCCGPITANGHRLAALLDSTGVDHLWLAGQHVIWTTGEPDPDRPFGRPEATHCSAFVGAIAKRLGIYVLRPPEHSQKLLASAQVRWMSSDGASEGWRALGGPADAQRAANKGEFVVEAFENPDPDRPGHIAIVRPSEKTSAELDEDGPEETQAGGHNAIDTTTARGFHNHRGAWLPGGNGKSALLGACD